MGNVLSWPMRCAALIRRSARPLWALDKMVKAVGTAHATGLSNYTLRLGQPGRLDQARQLRHLDRDRSKVPAATLAGQPRRASLTSSAMVIRDRRQ